MIEEHVPGRDDSSSVPIDERIGRYAAYLRDFLSFDDAILQLAGHAIVLKELEEKTQTMEGELRRIFSDIEQEYGELHDLAMEGARRGRLSSERFLKVLTAQAEKREKTSRTMSIAGKKSGQSRAKSSTVQEDKVIKYHQRMVIEKGARFAVGATAKNFDVSDTHIRNILKKFQNRT